MLFGAGWVVCRCVLVCVGVYSHFFLVRCLWLFVAVCCSLLFDVCVFFDCCVLLFGVVCFDCYDVGVVWVLSCCALLRVGVY